MTESTSLAAARRTLPTDHLTVVIVSWNTADLLDECIESVHLHGPTDSSVSVVVVDNASTDDSVAMVRRKWPQVTVIENSENVGFCLANNQAIRSTSGEWLLLINADAMLRPGSLDAMLRRARLDPRAGIIGPRLVYGDGSWQRWTAGRAPSLTSVASYLFGLDRLEARWPAAAGTYLGVDTRTAFQPDWVSSACMLVRRATLDEIGLLDESIFVYMDDVELCQRARDHGWNIWYEGGVDVVHLMGQSTKRHTGKASPEALRGFNRYFLAQHGARRTGVLRVMQTAGYALRLGIYRGLFAWRGDQRHRAQADAHLVHLKLTLEGSENPK